MAQPPRSPGALGALLVLLLIVAAGGLAGYLVLTGIGSENSNISHQLSAGADKIEGWLKDLGVGDSSAQQANHDVSAGTSDSFKALIHGVVTGIEQLASFAFFLAMAVLSLFFLLKDGPSIRSWTERHIGLPTDVAHTVTGRTLESLRGYFLGVTIVALFSAILVGGGALALGVPLAGTIAGADAAAGMVVIQLLSNGPLQQIVQPVAYGAPLGLHPLAVLVLTIAGGALFGTVGLIRTAPIASAIVRISADLSRARVEAAA